MGQLVSLASQCNECCKLFAFLIEFTTADKTKLMHTPLASTNHLFLFSEIQDWTERQAGFFFFNYYYFLFLFFYYFAFCRGKQRKGCFDMGACQQSLEAALPSMLRFCVGHWPQQQDNGIRLSFFAMSTNPPSTGHEGPNRYLFIVEYFVLLCKRACLKHCFFFLFFEHEIAPQVYLFSLWTWAST